MRSREVVGGNERSPKSQSYPRNYFIIWRQFLKQLTGKLTKNDGVVHLCI